MNHFLFNLILVISKLPLNFIYKITDFLIFFVFNVFRYRTKLIKDNIKNSFPEKSDKEIKEIIKGFHTHFSTLIAEIIKLFTITEEEQFNKLTINNLDSFVNRPNKSKNVVILLGHVINWELLFILKNLFLDTNIMGVYMKIQNKFWDEKILNLRSKYGVNLIKMENTLDLMRNTTNDGSSFFLLIGDQSPHISKAKFSLNFLGRETPIFVGYDFLSVEKKFDVFYLEVESTKRGKYTLSLHDIKPENGEEFKELEISKKYFQLLEATIRKNPSNYLWTHNRWKHKKGVDY
ncbi:MAG: lysophospholipid acyltransferase family protein [Solirubrobacteraceae bacterium]